MPMKTAQVDNDLFMFFDKMPEALLLYETVASRILARLTDVKVKVQKSQITFANKHGFAFVSLPVRRKKGWPDICIIVSFGLNYRVEHPKIEIATEPYPNRWTHYVIIQSVEDIDEQLLHWIAEAYNFSMNKSRRR